MVAAKKDQILKLLERVRVLRPRDLKQAGIARTYLNKLYREGLIDRPSRGLYVLANDEPSENRSYVEACRLVPRGVICLLSALRFHEITTQAPYEVWITIDGKARAPRIQSPPLRIVRATGIALTFGIEQHTIEGVEVRVYSAAKTVVDCFKYRHKIGLDVALEALRDGLRQKKATIDNLWQAAKHCRMTNVMRPYLDSIV